MESSFEELGFKLVEGGLAGADCLALEADLQVVLNGADQVPSHGVRNLLRASPELRARACGAPLANLAAAALGKPCTPVKGIYFDKCPDANWVVPWHQDLTIALAEQHQVPGFENWTCKHGAFHAQPPVQVLEDQVTLRIHLDDCPDSNGALRVVPGSHRLGRLTPERIRELRESAGEVSCAAKRGDILVMSPLILHASPKALEPSHRRIVHVEYSAARLPEPLRWFE